ncbi:MAG: RNA polymerase sigma factor [Undibacterium sp.]|nr:RNA polymerase sigma factor [Undibacterium sp.]
MTEEEMINAIKSSGRNQDLGLQALYRKGAEFRRHFVYKGLSPQLAEDFVQETIFRIFRGASSYSGGKGFGDSSANSWMWTIAKNVMTDHFRRKTLHEVSIDDDSMSDASKLALKVELASKNPHASFDQTAQDCVANGIEDFAAEFPDRAKVLEMQMDDEDIASIASRISRTVAATKEYLSQCKKKLAPFIEHCTQLLQP